MIHRRNFLIGLVAAPAIVRIDNIMPVKLFDVVVPPSLLEQAINRKLMLFRREVTIEYVRYLFSPYTSSNLEIVDDPSS